MIAIKGIDIPKTCYECSLLNIRYYICCSLIFSDCDCDRHPNCPLVEIVTCKYCKHWDKKWTPNVPDDKEYHFCPMMDCNTSEDFFCADGERKE